MSYGDGGFFFTQPVGNGYSGASQFYGAASKMAAGSSRPQYITGGPTPSADAAAGTASSAGTGPSGLRGSVIRTKGLTLVCQDVNSCTAENLQADIATIEAYWAENNITTMRGKMGSGYLMAYRQRQAKLASLAQEAEWSAAAEDTSSTTTTETTTEYVPMEYTTPTVGVNASTVSPMPMYTSPEMAPGTVDTSMVSYDPIEPEGMFSKLQNYVKEHPIPSAIVAGGLAYGGWKFAQYKGWVR